MLPLLKGGEGKGEVAFHVVAPSLPNYGFSEGVRKVSGILYWKEEGWEGDGENKGGADVLCRRDLRLSSMRRF